MKMILRAGAIVAAVIIGAAAVSAVTWLTGMSAVGAICGGMIGVGSYSCLMKLGKKEMVKFKKEKV